MEETEKETGKEPERAEMAQERTHAALSDICGYGTAVAENRREHFQCISVIAHGAALLAAAINRALQPRLSIAQLGWLTS